MDEGSRECVGDGSRRVAGGFSGCLAFCICELMARNFFVPSYLLAFFGQNEKPVSGAASSDD